MPLKHLQMGVYKHLIFNSATRVNDATKALNILLLFICIYQLGLYLRCIQPVAIMLHEVDQVAQLFSESFSQHFSLCKILFRPLLM